MTLVLQWHCRLYGDDFWYSLPRAKGPRQAFRMARTIFPNKHGSCFQIEQFPVKE